MQIQSFPVAPQQSSNVSAMSLVATVLSHHNAMLQEPTPSIHAVDLEEGKGDWLLNVMSSRGGLVPENYDLAEEPNF